MNTVEDHYTIFDIHNHLQPRMRKKEFETLHSWDLGWALLEPLNLTSDKEEEKLLSHRFSPGQKALYFFWYLDAEVVNGGFIQFYLNNNRCYLLAIHRGLELIGDKDMLTLLKKADGIYLKHLQKFQAVSSMEDFSSIYNELHEFEELDMQYYKLHDMTMDLIERYAREHIGEFLKLV